MCKQPIQIINPKLKAKHSNFDKNIDPFYLKVACGKCIECQQKKQQDWLTRLAFEYEYTKNIGGFVFFETFTYNENEVPELHGLKCFNKDHYKTFASELRTYLVRHYEKIFQKYNMGDDLFQTPYTYGYEYNPMPSEIEEETHLWNFTVALNRNQPIKPEFHPAGKLKIFWVSEYGGEYHRPHHHAIFFVQYKIKPYTFAYYVKKAWTHGFVDGRSPDKKIINSMKAIAYVSKYVCKDIEWTQTLTKQKGSRFMNYLKTKWKQVYNEELDEEIFKKLPCESVKKVLKEIGMEKAIPYIAPSRYLGIYGLEKININNLEQNKCTILDYKKGQKVVNIPGYLIRKKLYDYDKNIKYWQLNELGKIIKAREEKDKWENIITELENTFNTYINLVGYTWNVEYYKKIYSDIKTNKHSFNKLLILIKSREEIINKDIINYIKNGKIDDYKNKKSYDIINRTYINEYNHTEPFDYLVEDKMKKEIITVEEYLEQNHIKDMRYKYIMFAFDECQKYIRERRNELKDKVAQLEHLYKQLKTG